MCVNTSSSSFSLLFNHYSYMRTIGVKGQYYAAVSVGRKDGEQAQLSGVGE